jgi:NitT/TauT family transport system substrate-binding protein
MALVLSENFRALFYAPFYAAHAIGAYAAEGVDVALRTSPDPAATARALREGAADLMWGGPLRVILSRAENPASDLVGFCDVVRRDPFFVIGREPRPGFSLPDLAHLRLATVSEVPTPWLCLQDDLRRAGIDPAALPLVTGHSMVENAAALRRGEVDAVQIFQPFVEELIAAGHGHVWYAQASRGPTAYTMLVARRPVLEARHDEFLRVTRAMSRTLRWFAATPAAEIARALAEFFPDVAPPIFAAAIDRYRALELWCTDPRPNRQGFDRLHAAMRSGGALQRDILFEDCVETGLADRVFAAGSRDL